MANVRLVCSGSAGMGIYKFSQIVAEILKISNPDNAVSLIPLIGLGVVGGSITTYIKSGEKEESPVMSERTADIVVCFDKLEAAKNARFAAPDGIIVAFDELRVPTTVSSGLESYDMAGVDERIGRDYRIVLVNVDETSQAVGYKNLNIFMVGLVVRLLGISSECFLETLGRHFSDSRKAGLLAAFNHGFGFNLAREGLS